MASTRRHRSAIAAHLAAGRPCYPLPWPPACPVPPPGPPRPMSTATTVRQEVTIDRLVNWRLANPTLPWTRFVELYGISYPTVQKLTGTAFFQALLRQRMDEAQKRVDDQLRRSANAVLEVGLSRLIDGLNADELSHADTIKAVSVADRITGLSARSAPAPTPAPTTLAVTQNILQLSRERINGGPPGPLDAIPCPPADIPVGIRNGSPDAELDSQASVEAPAEGAGL